MPELTLTPTAVQAQLHKNGVTDVVWLPDTESSFMYKLLQEDPTLRIIPIAREAESMPIAAGLWIGGRKPIVMIQNTGFFESGDSVRGMAVDIAAPLVIIIGYRGWTRRGITKDSAATITEPTLNAWRMNYYLVEHDGDVDRISAAFQEAVKTQKPVGVLVGAEYSG
jgi:sulfopyruvate decarboxylase TPP-binding subunit